MDHQLRRRQLAALAAVTAAQEESEFAELCTGWAIGTEGWKRAVAKEYRHLALDPGYDATELHGLKERRWREQLELLLLGAGKSAIRLAPPLCISRDEIDWAVERLRKVLA